MDLLYRMFTLSGMLYALHGIAYSILTFVYNRYEVENRTNLDTLNFSYLVFRLATSSLIFFGNLALNAIRYNTCLKSDNMAVSVGTNYTKYQKSCYTGIAFMLCVQYAYHALTRVDDIHDLNTIDTIRFYVDITGSFWLWYSLLYRDFVDNSIMVIRGGYTKTEVQQNVEPVTTN